MSTFPPGTRVRVLPVHEILATLDARGHLDGLPFMPEMARFCGGVYEVARPVNRLMVEGTGVRGMPDVVILDGLRCDGGAHDGCQRRCTILWKSGWLTTELVGGGGDEVSAEAPPTGPCQGDGDVLLQASRPLSVLAPGQYVEEVRSGGASPREVLAMLRRMTSDRLRWQVGKARAVLHSRWPRVVPARRRFEPGQWVRVRPAEEIRLTLDRDQRLRGLQFSDAMWRFCGQRFKILAGVNRMVVEETGQLRKLADTWFLDEVVCDGVTFRGCPRRCYWYWRGAWLEPAEEGG